MRDALRKINPSQNIFVGTAGSFARREASNESDLDFFLITKTKVEEAQRDEIIEQVKTALHLSSRIRRLWMDHSVSLRQWTKWSTTLLASAMIMTR
jgi:predicted nucleotidyltransferase